TPPAPAWGAPPRPGRGSRSRRQRARSTSFSVWPGPSVPPFSPSCCNARSPRACPAPKGASARSAPCPSRAARSSSAYSPTRSARRSGSRSGWSRHRSSLRFCCRESARRHGASPSAPLRSALTQRRQTPPLCGTPCAGQPHLVVETGERNPQMKLNLAARAGRWGARHWKTATFGWVAVVLVAVILGGAIGTKQLDQNTTGPGESGRMAKILDEEFKQPAGETVLIQSSSLTAKDPAFKAGIEDVARRISAGPVDTNVRNPLEPAYADQISDDGHAAIVQFDIRGDPKDAADKVDPLLAAVDDSKAANPELTIGEYGEASAEKDIMDRVGEDLSRAGLLSIPVTLVILLVAFGALVAAGIPLLLALSAVAATMGLLAVPSHIWPLEENVRAVVLLIGLAVGVDYSLFYLKREREERAKGRSESAALQA